MARAHQIFIILLIIMHKQLYAGTSSTILFDDDNALSYKKELALLQEDHHFLLHQKNYLQLQENELALYYHFSIHDWLKLLSFDALASHDKLKKIGLDFSLRLNLLRPFSLSDTPFERNNPSSHLGLWYHYKKHIKLVIGTQVALSTKANTAIIARPYDSDPNAQSYSEGDLDIAISPKLSPFVGLMIFNEKNTFSFHYYHSLYNRIETQTSGETQTQSTTIPFDWTLTQFQDYKPKRLNLFYQRKIQHKFSLQTEVRFESWNDYQYEGLSIRRNSGVLASSKKQTPKGLDRQILSLGVTYKIGLSQWAIMLSSLDPRTEPERTNYDDQKRYALTLSWKYSNAFTLNLMSGSYASSFALTRAW